MQSDAEADFRALTPRFGKAGKGNRRAVFQIATDDLDANRQLIACMTVRRGSCRAGRSGSQSRPKRADRCRGSLCRPRGRQVIASQ